MTIPFGSYIQGLAAASFVTSTDLLYINQGGTPEAGSILLGLNGRMPPDVSIASNTSLANLSGMSVTVAASRTYTFEAYLFIKSGASNGGVQAAINGTCTASDLVYDGWAADTGGTPLHGYALATALGLPVAAAKTASDTTTIYIRGTIAVSASGTLTVQGA
jgi:hypothetical protein